jgi:hypothetical protein
MKVLCINGFPLLKDSKEIVQLSPGKIYDVIKVMRVPFSHHRYNDPDLFYLIKCDTGEEKHFSENNFRELTQSELRQLKLDELLNENNCTITL